MYNLELCTIRSRQCKRAHMHECAVVCHSIPSSRQAAGTQWHHVHLQSVHPPVHFTMYMILQARAVIDGLPADMVALALPLDIDKIMEAGLIDITWRNRFPNGSVVCETTVAFVVGLGHYVGRMYAQACSCCAPGYCMVSIWC